MTMIALRPFTYGGEKVRKGETFEPKYPKHVKILKVLKKADDYYAPVEAEKPKPRGRPKKVVEPTVALNLSEGERVETPAENLPSFAEGGSFVVPDGTPEEPKAEETPAPRRRYYRRRDVEAE